MSPRCHRLSLATLLLLTAAATAAEPVDRLGDPLPPDAFARLGTIRLRHSNFISALAFSPTARLVAAGDGNGDVVLWSLESGKQLQRFHIDVDRPPANANLQPITSLAFSLGGKSLVVVRNQTLRVWDVAAAKEMKVFKKDEKPVCTEAALSPDGKVLATVGNGNRVELWDFASGKALEGFEGYQGPVNTVAFSPDGKLLAAGDGGTIRLWDRDTRKQVGKFRRHSGTVLSLAFSPDAKSLASGSEDQTIRLWDVATGKEVRRLPHPFTRPATQHFLADYNTSTATVAFTPDGKEVISSVRSDRMIRRWDAATGKELARYEGHQDGSIAVALSADGKTLAAGGEDATVRLWNVADGKDLFPEDGHRGRVFNLAFARDGKTLLSAGRDNAMRVWDLGTRRPLRQFAADADRIGMIAFTSDGKTAATARADDEIIQLWDTTTGKLRRELARKQTGVYGLAFAGDGKHLAAAAEEGIYVWDVPAGQVVREISLAGKNRNVGSWLVAYSDDGSLIASVTDGQTMYLWDGATGKEIRHFGEEQQGPQPFRLFISPDNRTLAAITQDNHLCLWSVSNGKLLYKLSGFGFVRDGTMMVPESVAFSPDSRTIAAVGTDAQVHLYEVLTGREVRKFQGKQGWLGALAFSPDGRAIATGGIDTTVLLWDVTGRRGTTDNELSAKEMEKLWADMVSEDVPAAHGALWRLAAAPVQSVPWLREKVKPTDAMEAKRFASLIADLDSDKFAVRQKAGEELEKHLDEIEGELRKLLLGKPSLEVRQRVEKLLERSGGPPAADRLRTLRALTVLEQASTPEARQVLEKLAMGSADAWMTREAKAALRRLGR